MKPETKRYPREVLTDAEKTALYNDHVPMAKYLAVKFARRYAIPYEDAEYEALHAMGMALATWSDPGMTGYNPTSKSRRGWLYHCIFYGLATYATRTRPRHNRTPTFTALAATERTLPACNGTWFGRLLRTLGADARVVVETIVNAPAELADDMKHPGTRKTRRAVGAYLIARGWAADRFNAAWDELGAAL